ERAKIPLTHSVLSTMNGDFLSASQAGEFYKGAHMIDILNHLKIDLAVFGNHEFDFGSDVLAERVAESKFKWLGSNVKEKSTGKLFANAINTMIVPIGPEGNLKLGIFGFCTPETPQLSFPGGKVVFEDIIETSQRCVDELLEQGADVIMAITHVSIAHDKLVARRIPRIDIMIGGHDHDPYTLYQGKTFIHKSGQNAYWLGRLDFHITKEGSKVNIVPEWKMIANRNAAADPEIKALVDKYMARFTSDDALALAARQLAVLELPLDTRTSLMRGEEGNFGNLVADAIRSELGAQFGLVNGGFVRGDNVHPAKTVLTAGMVMKEMPFPRPAVLLKIKASDLKEAIEQHLRAYPALSGSFPHVSGLKIIYDRSNPEQPKITQFYNEFNKDIDLNSYVTVATTKFIAGGGDGCTAWKKAAFLSTHDQIAQEVIRFQMPTGLNMNDDLFTPVLLSAVAIALPLLTWSIIPFQDDSFTDPPTYGMSILSAKAYIALQDKVGVSLTVLAAIESFVLSMAISMSFKHIVLYRLRNRGITLAAVDISNKDPLQASLQFLHAPSSIAAALALLLFSSMLVTILDNIVYQWVQFNQVAISPFSSTIGIIDSSQLADNFFPLVDGNTNGDLYAAQTPLTAWAFSAGISAVASMNNACTPEKGCGLTKGNSTFPLLQCDATNATSPISCQLDDIPIYAGYTMDCFEMTPEYINGTYAVQSDINFIYNKDAYAVFDSNKSYKSLIDPPCVWWNMTLKYSADSIATSCKFVPAWTVRTENTTSGMIKEKVVYKYNDTLTPEKIEAIISADSNAFVIQKGIPFVFHQFAYAANFLSWFYNTTCRMGDTNGNGPTGGEALFCDEASGLPVLTSVKRALSIRNTSGLVGTGFLQQEMQYVVEMLYRPILSRQTSRKQVTKDCSNCVLKSARVVRRAPAMILVCLVNFLSLSLCLSSFYLSIVKKFPKGSLYAADVVKLVATQQEAMALTELDPYVDPCTLKED
ncbi:calcineurin-like phosphoesterase, partial [Thraustotheca clavata]